MKASRPGSATLLIIFGDQLDAHATPFSLLDKSRDTILMMEVAEESTHVPSHIQRTVLFLSAMRHFARDLELKGWNVRYVRLDDPANTHSFDSEVERAVRDLKPARLLCTEPGEHRIRARVRAWQQTLRIPVEVFPDTHFLTTPQQFADFAKARKELVMEHFYRKQRTRLNILVEPDGAPVGDAWNFDKDNRLPFPKTGPTPKPPAPPIFAPDEITNEVIRDVRKALPHLPGRVDRFNWPVTAEQAGIALEDFIANRLSRFGPYEDAMWTGEPFLYHSLLAAPLNLKLLNPRDCVNAAINAYKKRQAPLQSVEGFIRQIIGWREFIRGVYDYEGPDYAARNALTHKGALPEFYWNAQTDMNCLRNCITEVLEHAFGHHIQRLMITGNFALIAGVHPRAISDWYLGMYADAVDWVTLPNTLGMSQHADARPGTVGGVVGTKPYAASANYIGKMSNYCKGCAYDPKQRLGENACPFNTLYWAFLIRHEKTFARNHRMTMIMKNVQRMPSEEKAHITISARAVKRRLGIDP